MDATFWAFVALIIFLGVLAYFKVPGMINGALDGRAERIRNELDEARKLREDAQQLLAEYQRKRQEAEQEAQDIVSAAKHEALLAYRSQFTAEGLEELSRGLGAIDLGSPMFTAPVFREERFWANLWSGHVVCGTIG